MEAFRHVSAPWTVVGDRGVVDLLGIEVGMDSNGSTCVWGSASAPRTCQELELAAWLLAASEMERRAGASGAFERWRKRAQGGPPHADGGASIRPFVSSAVGLPGAAAVPDHLQGFVAQLIWWSIAKEFRLANDNNRRLVEIESPGFWVTEQGPDGLVIYEQGIDGTLCFRLWEIKKHDAKGPVTGTVARASDQLQRFTGSLGRIYAELVELWVNSSPRSGVGVSVTTTASQAHRSTGPFGSLVSKFPSLGQGGQREGLLVQAPNFRWFSRKVQKVLWSGL
jgi:hypothetical protein